VAVLVCGSWLKARLVGGVAVCGSNEITAKLRTQRTVGMETLIEPDEPGEGTEETNGRPATLGPDSQVVILQG
jgi:hypothetical protein